jgi:DNA repair photolyase
MTAMTNLIYEPKGRAREYAALACNVYRGCDHACVYCYAPSATQRQRADFVLSSTRGPDFLPSLEREAARLSRTGAAGKQVLLSFTCDPYQAIDAQHQVTRRAIQILHRNGFNVCTLTKGGYRALRDLDLFGAHDAFATTMTLLDDAASLEWEPGAALPSERIDTIRQFHAAGITTWVSLEPVIDPAAALEIIRLTHQFVDLYKVGKMNYHPIANEIDWRQFALDAVSLLDSLSKRYYVKNDLAAFLPGGKAPNAITQAELESATLSLANDSGADQPSLF